MAQQLPKNVSWITLDCYGTLIDWDKGIADAFEKEAARDGLTVEGAEVLPIFHDKRREITKGSYELYAEVLRRAAVETAEELGWELEPARSQFLPDSVPWWPPFRDANAALDRIKKQNRLGIVSNIDDKLLGVSRRHLRAELDIVVTAQQVRSYKPEPAHFRECARRIGGKKGWIHIGSDYEMDVEPALKQKVPVIWLNRTGEELDKRRKPSAQVKSLKEATDLLGLK